MLIIIIFNIISEDEFGDNEGEDYDDWADRINREWRQKQQAKYPTSHDSRNRRKRNKPSHDDDDPTGKKKKISDEAKREFNRKTQEEFKQKYNRMQRDMQTGRKSRLIAQKKKYAQSLEKMFDKTSEAKLGLKDIPWPFVSGKGLDSMTDLLLCDLDKGTPAHRKYLKRQQVCWHPDKFVQRCGNRLIEKDKEKVMKRVNEISQKLNKLVEGSVT